MGDQRVEPFYLLLVRYGSESAALKVKSDLGYNDLISRCCSRWNSLHVDGFTLSYSVPDHPKVRLSNEEDLNIMFIVLDSLKVGVVSIEIEVTNRSVECETPRKESETSGRGGELIAPVVSSRSVECEMVREEGETGCKEGELIAAVVSSDCGLDSGSNLCDIAGPSSSARLKNIVAREAVSDFGYDSLDDCKGLIANAKETPVLSSGWSSNICQVGQGFPGGAVEFRHELCEYAVALGFDFNYVRNEGSRITAECANKVSQKCMWFVTAKISHTNKWFYITKLNNVHTCELSVQSNMHKRMGSSLMAKLLVDRGVNICCSPTFVVEFFRTEYNVPVNYTRAWRALESARSLVFGNYKETFEELQRYVEALKRTNIGTHVALEVDENESLRCFRRIFVSFGACIEGFNHCRPLLFIDATSLQSRFGGTLLSATGKDANQGLFPLAFCVVDSENEENWRWFLTNLKHVLNMERPLTLVSDRNADLSAAIPIIFPKANHFICIHHLKCNLREKFSGRGSSSWLRTRIVNLFRGCAYAETKEAFDKNMSALRKEGGHLVEEFLSTVPYDQWSNVHSNGMRYGEMSLSAAESFNSWILPSEGLPIIQMIECIRMQLMDWFNERKKKSLEWDGILCPKMTQRWDRNDKISNSWTVGFSYDNMLEVHSEPSARVDLHRSYCSCHSWQIKGFPCVHAVAAMRRSNRVLPDAVDKYFHVSSYRACYDREMLPVPSIATSEFSGVDGQKRKPGRPKGQPGRPKGQPGRPKRAKTKSKWADVRRVTCGRCGVLGNHNRKSCKENIQSR